MDEMREMRALFIARIFYEAIRWILSVTGRCARKKMSKSREGPPMVDPQM